jgi:16S rRNA processing protein RimM
VSKKPPEKLVVMGRVAAPFGVKGLIKVQPFTAATRSLLAYDWWWFGRDGDWQQYEIERAQVQGRSVVAKIRGCDDRDGALQFRGRQIAIPRAAFPRTAGNEFYWADLIGLRVVNSEARDFGRVTGILETGANDVLVVHGERERLIPFIADVIEDVDFGRGMIRVDWSADF